MVFLKLPQEALCFLELRQCLQRTSRVASGKSGLLSSFEGHLGIPQEVLQWNRASFHVQGAMSWFFSSYGGKLGVPLEL